MSYDELQADTELNSTPNVFSIDESTWREHREWSDRCFGNGGPVGSLKHFAS